MTKKVNRLVYWIPRALAILFILFLMVFSLDIFEPGLTCWQIAIGLFMHNIPSLILAIVLLISWRYEIVGGVAFIIAGLAHMISSVMRADVEPWYMTFAISLILDAPAILIGILFLIGWYKKRK
jgi:hypothetical protein